MLSLGDRVRKAREAKGLGNNELDAAAKLGKGYSSRVENGKRKKLGPATMRKISDALDVSYEWLADGAGPMAPVISVATTTSTEIDRRYPNLSLALARYRDPVIAAVAEVESLAMLRPSDASVEEWLDELAAAERHARASARGKLAEAHGGLTDEDLAPPPVPRRKR